MEEDNEAVDSQSEEELESDEEYESEEEDSDEDEEPKLKYIRLGANVSEILEKDAASCMALHEKFTALGTHWGIVYILDFNGNEIKKFPCHTTTVNEISIDLEGEYIASCSDDGKVCINGLYSDEKFEHTYHRPLTSVALDPRYSKSNSKEFVVGGKSGQLISNKKGFFRAKDNILHSGEGAIHSIKWRADLIAWANDIGVKIFDCNTKQRITYIGRPKGSPRPDLYRCHLSWESDDILLIGWADSIKIGQVKTRGSTSNVPGSGSGSGSGNNDSQGLPTRYVEIIALFQTDYYLSGLAPFKNYLVTLAYTNDTNNTDTDTDNKAKGNTEVSSGLRPELRIITRTDQEVSSDSLTIHGFQNYTATDYRLEYIKSESWFYIVSPKDIVVAKPRDLDDHISWLLEKEDYYGALMAAREQESLLIAHKLSDIGELYLNYLLDNQEITEAAQATTDILKNDPKLWEKWIYKFAKIRQLQAIGPFIPVGKPGTPELSDTVYEMVLNYFLSIADYPGFVTTVQNWPSTLYNIQHVITAVKEKLKKTRSEYLMDALALLYTYAKQYDETLNIYLRLRRGNVFELISKYDLFDSISDKVALLMQFDTENAVKLLVKNPDRIPVRRVVSQLESKKELCHAYLHSLFLSDPHIAPDFHQLQVTLYADYDPKQLLHFLRQSHYYPLDEAFQVCKDRNLYKEMVFILGRMGNNQEALQLIIEKQQDIQEAIDFVKSQDDDDELWEDLIKHAMTKAEYVAILLENVGAHVDPISLINTIPEGMKIVGLGERLVKIISDYNLQTSLREGCNNILKSDVVDLNTRLVSQRKAAVKIEAGFSYSQFSSDSNSNSKLDSDTFRPKMSPFSSNYSKCAICSSSIEAKKKNDLIVQFNCGHIYHQSCLKRTTESQESGLASGGGDSEALANNNNQQQQQELQLQQNSIESLMSQNFSCPICVVQTPARQQRKIPTK